MNQDLDKALEFAASRRNFHSLLTDDICKIENGGADVDWHGLHFYIGVNLRCESCNCVFPFSSSEQQYWRETLHLNIQAFPVECSNCRAKTREASLLRIRHDKLISTCTFTKPECDEIFDIVGKLLDLGRVNSNGPKYVLKLRRAAKHTVNVNAQAIISKIEML